MKGESYNFLCPEKLAWTEQACLENLLSLGHLPYLSGVVKGGRYRGHAPVQKFYENRKKKTM